MSSGGARNRSGPSPDPNSARSEARGYSLTALPAEGYKGRIPRFPLPPRELTRKEIDDDGNEAWVADHEMIEAIKKREAAMWRWAWRTPQACAWALPSESWRLMTVAMWVRTFVICEGSDATAADKNSLHRFADQIGLTTAGLAEMGWKIATAGDGAAGSPTAPPAAKVAGGSRSRMEVVQGGVA